MPWRSDVAMGGSTNTILHTLAIAREAGINYDIARIDAISRRVPCLCKVSPSSNYHVQDVHRAGGIHTILGELKRLDEANGWTAAAMDADVTPKAKKILNLSCMTVTGQNLGQNIEEWDVRSAQCSPLAKAVRVSGASALALDPEDKLGPAARTASGNLAPKPMMFFSGDDRSVALWRVATAWNCGDAESQMAVYDTEAELKVDGENVLKGPAAICAWMKQKLADSQGLDSRRTCVIETDAGVAVLAICRGRRQKAGCTCCGWPVIAGGHISKAYLETRPAQLNDAQASGLMPYDPAFMFEAQDCIRTLPLPTHRKAGCPCSTANWRRRAAS